MSDELTWPTVLTALLEGDDLSVSQAEWAMSEFMTGSASGAQMGGFLVGLRAKGVTVDEIVGFRDAILAEATPIALPVESLDIVGTGGDRYGTVNVSTTASIVAAAAGAPVVKHGNRAASSKSGSSDVLTALGVSLSLNADQLRRSFADTGIAFVHAARFLPGFRHVAPTRAELGIPTVFNFLGPLCNPVRPEASAVGVADAERAPLIAGVFRIRGASALVFRGDDGLDELTTTGHSRIWEVSRGGLTEHDLDPRDLGIPRASIDDLLGGTPEENAAIVHRVLSGEAGPVRDIVLLNAAAGLVAFDLVRNPESVERPLLDRLAALARGRGGSGGLRGGGAEARALGRVDDRDRRSRVSRRAQARRTAATNSSMSSRLFTPGALSTPLDTSTPQGRAEAIASATFAGERPPASSQRSPMRSGSMRERSHRSPAPPAAPSSSSSSSPYSPTRRSGVRSSEAARQTRGRAAVATAKSSAS